MILFSFNSIQLLPLFLLFVDSITSFWLRYCWLYSTTRSAGKCALVKNYYKCLIKIISSSCYLLFCFNASHFYTTKYKNTLHSHYFVVLCERFWTTGLFKWLAIYQWILNCTIILSSEYHNISKGKWDILEILTLLLHLSFLMLNFCNTIFHI